MFFCVGMSSNVGPSQMLHEQSKLRYCYILAAFTVLFFSFLIVKPRSLSVRFLRQLESFFASQSKPKSETVLLFSVFTLRADLGVFPALKKKN